MYRFITCRDRDSRDNAMIYGAARGTTFPFKSYYENDNTAYKQ